MKALMKTVAVSAAIMCGVAAKAGELPDEYELRPSIIAQADANGASGTIPYIDTGFAPNQDTHIIIQLDVSDSTEYWFGAWDVDWNNKAFAMGNDGGSTYVGWHTQGGGIISTIPNGTHTLEIDHGAVKVDGETWKTLSPQTFQLERTIYLFAQNRNGTPSTRAVQNKQCVTCLGCKIYDDTTLVRDFVPCVRKADSVAGLYDLENGRFYTNDGNGELVCSAPADNIVATAVGYDGIPGEDGAGITVNVTRPLDGAGCTYEWAVDGGEFGPTEPRFFERGVYNVTCRVSCEGMVSAEVSATVTVRIYDSAWTYDADAGTLADGVWTLKVSDLEDGLRVDGVQDSQEFPDMVLDLAKPISGSDAAIVAIGDGSFNAQRTAKFKQIVRLVLPNTLRSIGEEAFYLCSGLKMVEPFLPPSVTTIGHYAFSGCLALKGDLSIGSVGGAPTSWKVPGSSSGTSQFDNCPKITSVVLHSATNVPGWCFQHDAAVTNVVFEGELAAIGESAFYDCPGIRSVTPLLPPSVTKIGKGAFQGCASLKGELVVGRPGGPVVEMASDVENEPNHFASTAIGSAVFHSVRIIPNECFHYCTSLTNVVLCEGIERIGRYAFGSCTALTTVTPFLPQSVRHVGGFAFYQCSNLSGNLFVGQRNKPLEWDSPGDPNRQWADHQFAEIFALKSATIYGDIDEIMANCFVMDSALETVHIYSKTPIDIQKEAFAGYRGPTPPIRDLYINAFATFGENAFRDHPDYGMRLWVARGNAQWDAWIAENVTSWNELGDVTNNFYTAFGAGARKPVGLVKDGVQPARQWVMRWNPGVGTMVLVR